MKSKKRQIIPRGIATAVIAAAVVLMLAAPGNAPTLAEKEVLARCNLDPGQP